MKTETSHTEAGARDFFKNSGTGIVLLEEDGIITLANEEFARKTGFTRDEIEGKIRWWDLVHDDDIERMTKLHRLRRQNPERIRASYDFRYKMKSGELGEALLSIMMIPGTGKSIVSLVDLTGRKMAEEVLRYQKALQQLLVDLATRFINTLPESIDAILNQMLDSIGSFTKMDRTYIFIHDYAARTSSNTHEWCAKGIRPQIHTLQGIPFNTIHDILNAHRNGGIYHIADLSAMPQEDSLRLLLEPQEIRSLVLLPLQHEGTDLGFVGFDAVRGVRNFEEAEIALLQVAAEIISNALARQRKAQIIQKSLDEKNVLLSEIHHRVKNNMAIISSLLALQSDFFPGKNDTKSILEEMQHRIKSMALVHEMVYENKNFTAINFGQLLQRLIGDFRKVYDDKVIEVTIRADDIMLNMNDSVPFSLLANELMLNACKHAFPDRKRGNIEVTFKRERQGCLLVVSDDGVGMSDTNALQKPETLGYTIIQTLIKQLGGEIEIQSSKPGLTVESRFPLSV